MIEKAEEGDGELLGHLMLTARKVAKEQGLEKVADQCPFTGVSKDYFECRLKAVTHCTHILVTFQLYKCILLNVLHSGIPSGHQQWSGGLPVSLPSAHSCSRRSSAQLAPWLKVSFGNQIPISAAVPWPYTLFLHSGRRKLFCYIPASTLAQADTS